MEQQRHHHVDSRTGRISITSVFGESLATLLADRIIAVYPSFPKKDFCARVRRGVVGKSYTERVEFLADALRDTLPEQYTQALSILTGILGPENPKETGMFSDYYWLMPVAKFIEKYGLEHFGASTAVIGEVTKRNTGEYAIRPYARKYPEKTLALCKRWAKSKNFHLRRLASEGLRPKLPWASKLDVWSDNPAPVFEILEILKADEVMFVKKSVANHLRDWVKVNPLEAQNVITRWSASKNKHTQWILKHAQR